MGDCKLLSTCPFYKDQMESMPATSEMMKRKYCRADSTDCARFVVFSALGREMVPSDLAPSQIDRARKIVNSE